MNFPRAIVEGVSLPCLIIGTIGTTTPDEAREIIDLSLDFLNRRLPDNELQKTRSKKSLDTPTNSFEYTPR